MTQAIRRLPLVVAATALIVVVYAAPAMAEPPTLTIENATKVYASGATLNGTINPHEKKVEWYFVYGTCKELATCGTATPRQVIPAGSKGSTHISANVYGLAKGWTHHVVIFAAPVPWTEEPTLSKEEEFDTRGYYYVGGEKPHFAHAIPISSVMYWKTWGESDEPQPFFAFVSGEMWLECTKEEATEGPEVSAEFASFGFVPEFGSCNTSGLATTVKPNGCQYVYTAAENAHAAFELSCEAGKKFEFTFTDPFFGSCTVKIPGQKASNNGTWVAERPFPEIVDFELFGGLSLYTNGTGLTYEKTSGCYSPSFGSSAQIYGTMLVGSSE
jgi:hypothetical protein